MQLETDQLQIMSQANTLRLTKDLVTNVVLPDEVSQQFLVDPRLVDDLITKTFSLIEVVSGHRPAYGSIPKRAS